MKKRMAVQLAIAALLLVASVLTIAASGTAEDPLISLSYLNGVLVPQLEEKVDTRVKAAMANELGQAVQEAVDARFDSGELPAQSGGSQYVAVQLAEGQSILSASGSLEVLLRRGIFHCVDPEGQGITNVTLGSEVSNGSDLTLQNLYLIPREDGRGILCDSAEGWVMVRGSYTLTGGVTQTAPEAEPAVQAPEEG
ncbi:MAG: hypothetical protein GXX99_07770 [Clostridiales bacterium]|nr:hypothetical protein [Clostridiales bacterium]